MNLERWLRDSRRWVEESGKPFGRWLEETGSQMKPEAFSKGIADRSEEWQHLLSEWGREVSERFRNWSASPGASNLILGLEDLQKFGTRLQGEWSRMAEWLQLGDRYHDAIRAYFDAGRHMQVAT